MTTTMTVRDFRKNINSTLLKSEVIITLYGKQIARVQPIQPLINFDESTTTKPSKKN